MPRFLRPGLLDKASTRYVRVIVRAREYQRAGTKMIIDPDATLKALVRLRELTDSGARYDLAAVMLSTGMTEAEIEEIGGLP